MKLVKNLYINQRFYAYISIISAVFLVSFWIPLMYSLAWFLVMVLVVVFFGELYLLFRTSKGIIARRLLTEKFSNSDEIQ